jgi:hypothetical protein
MQRHAPVARACLPAARAVVEKHAATAVAGNVCSTNVGVLR